MNNNTINDSKIFYLNLINSCLKTNLSSLLDKKKTIDFLWKFLELIRERNMLRESLERGDDNIQRLEKSLEEFKNQYEDTKRFLHIAEDEKGILIKQGKEFESRIDEFTNRISELEKLLDDKESDFKKLESEKQSLLDEKNKLERQLQEENERFSEENKKQSEAISDLESKLAELEASKFTEPERKMVVKIRELIIRLKSFNSSNFASLLEEVRRENLSNYPHLTDIIQSLIELGDAIIRQMNEFNGKMKEKDEKITELNSRISRNQENWNREKSEMNNRISSLNSELDRARYEVNKISGLNSAVTSLRSEISSLRSKSIDNYSKNYYLEDATISVIPNTIGEIIFLKERIEWNKYGGYFNAYSGSGGYVGHGTSQKSWFEVKGDVYKMIAIERCGTTFFINKF